MKKKTKIFLLEFIILMVIGSFYSRWLVSFIWAILHEIAHIIVARFLNIELGNMQINLTGVSTYGYELEELDYKKRLIIYLAGPLSNLLFVLILVAFHKVLEISFLRESIDINITLAVFNMLPAYPLDGARIYEILLGKKFLYKKAKDILITVSFGLSVILVLLFCMSVYIHSVNFSFLLTSVLIIYSTVIEKRMRTYITIGNIFRKRRRIIRNDYIENKSISIYYKVTLVKILMLIDKERFNCFYILDDEMKFLGIIYEDTVIDGLKKYGNITVKELMIKNKKDN